MSQQVIVLGAGMVGVCCALSLQRRGLTVTLIDRRAPGLETSFGNSGVFSRGSIFPINGPGLPRQLPAYLGNHHPAVRIRAGFVIRNPSWAARFLGECTAASLARRSQALDQLVARSMELNRRTIAEAGLGAHLRETGWLKVWRSPSGAALARREAQALATFGIETEVLDGAGVARLEPHAAPVFQAGLLTTGSASVDDPGAIVAGYSDLFARHGGRILRREARDLEPTRTGWQVGTNGDVSEAGTVVLALGPWSADLMQRVGLHVPLGFERGYHLHHAIAAGAGPSRPIYDAERGYVISPMVRGVRITSGVELADRDAPPNDDQIETAVASARDVFALGQRLDASPWLGARPTFPDCLPMIGPVPRRPGLFAAFGHQHIGFSTGAGTGDIIAAQVTGQPIAIDTAPFAPARYLL